MDREGFRNRLKQYKKAREENPGLKYWEWKAIPKYEEGVGGVTVPKYRVRGRNQDLTDAAQEAIDWTTSWHAARKATGKYDDQYASMDEYAQRSVLIAPKQSVDSAGSFYGTPQQATIRINPDLKPKWGNTTKSAIVHELAHEMSLQNAGERMPVNQVKGSSTVDKVAEIIGVPLYHTNEADSSYEENAAEYYARLSQMREAMKADPNKTYELPELKPWLKLFDLPADERGVRLMNDVASVNHYNDDGIFMAAEGGIVPKYDEGTGGVTLKEKEDAFWRGDVQKMSELIEREGKQLIYVTPESNLDEVVVTAKNLKKQKQRDREYNNLLDLGITAAGFIPGLGEVADAADAVNQLRQGNYIDAALTGLGFALPFVPGSTLRKSWRYLTDKKFRDRVKSLGPRIKEYSEFSPEITSEENLRKFNEEILQDTDIQNQLKQAEWDLKQGRISLDERLPPITSLALQTHRGKKAYPNGYDILYRGKSPAKEVKNEVRSLLPNAVFSFDSPDAAAYYQVLKDNNYISFDSNVGRYSPTFVEKLNDVVKGGTYAFIYPKNINKNIFDVNRAFWNELPTNITGGYDVTDDIAHDIQMGLLPTTQLNNIVDGAIGNVIIYNNKPGQYLKSAFGSNLKFDLNDPKPFAEGGEVTGPPTEEQWYADITKYNPTILDNASLQWSIEQAKKDLHAQAMGLPGYAPMWNNYMRSLPKDDPDINEFVDQLWEYENPDNVGYNSAKKKYYPHKSPEGGKMTIGPGFKLGSGSHNITEREAKRGVTKARLDQEARRVGKQHLNAVDQFLNYGQTTNPADTVSPQIKMGLMDLRHQVGPLNEWGNLRQAVLEGDLDKIKKESTVTWKDNGVTKVDKRRKKLRDKKYWHY